MIKLIQIYNGYLNYTRCEGISILVPEYAIGVRFLKVLINFIDRSQAVYVFIEYAKRKNIKSEYNMQNNIKVYVFRKIHYIDRFNFL